MSNNRPHIKNLKSKSTIMDGQVEQPRPPEADDLLYGEIAMNYKSGMETLYIKNDTDEIVGFKSSEQTESEIEEIRQTISDDELVISSALNDLNDRIIDESEERSSADNEISQRLGNEITNRESADRILKSDVMSAIQSIEIPSPDGTTITRDINGNFQTNLTIHKLDSEELEDLSDENVMEAYKLIYATDAGKTAIGDIIKVYKDSSLIEVYLGSSQDTINATTGVITKQTVTDPQSMNFAYHLADNTYSLTKIDISKFLTESEFGRGLDVSGAGVVSVKNGAGIDFNSSNALTLKNGDGLEFDSNGNLKVKAYNGITVDSNGVAVEAGDGLQIAYGELQIKTTTTSGLTVDSNGIVIKTPSNSGLNIDTDGVTVKAYNGITVDSNGVSVKPASTTEIGGVAIHDVHKTLIYEYHPIIGYTDDDVVVISVEEYNALPQEEKDLYFLMVEALIWGVVHIHH